MNQCNENMPYIFISYSHRDSDLVLPIIYRLKEEGYNVWYDDGIEAGTEWDENVAKHIEKCSYFIVFVSDNYIGSKNCKDELNYSRDLNKEMFLIYLKDVELPGGMAMRLNRIQAVFWNKYMPDNIEEAYQKIFKASGIEKTKVFMFDTDTENQTQVSIPHIQQKQSDVSGMNASTNERTDTLSEKKKIKCLKTALMICGIFLIVLLILVIILGAMLINGRTDKVSNNEANTELYADVDDNHPLYEYYKKAMAGDIDAMMYLGDAYLNGEEGVTVDYVESLYWIEKAADTGNVTAMLRAADYYYDGIAVSADGYQKCIGWCDKVLETEPDNAEAMYLIGNCYYQGQYGVEEDPELAFSWWHQAATRGHLDAIYNIVWCYNNGYGVVANHDKAEEWNQILIDTNYDF